MNLKKAALLLFLSVAAFPAVTGAKTPQDHAVASAAQSKGRVGRFVDHFRGHKKR
jgi:hypothetical protein